MSFHPSDPSFNNATGLPPLNLLGRPGAILSDLALQSLGLAGFILSLVLDRLGMARHAAAAAGALVAAAPAAALRLSS